MTDDKHGFASLSEFLCAVMAEETGAPADARLQPSTGDGGIPVPPGRIRAEILALPAGRELDALIAWKLMGYTDGMLDPPFAALPCSRLRRRHEPLPSSLGLASRRYAPAVSGVR